MLQLRNALQTAEAVASLLIFVLYLRHQVRYDAGSAFKEHGHPDGEEILVLEGAWQGEARMRRLAWPLGLGARG